TARMDAVLTLAPTVGVQAACRALGVPRATFYGARRRPGGTPPAVAAPPAITPPAPVAGVSPAPAEAGETPRPHPHPRALPAEQLIADAVAKQDIVAGQLTVHADRGSSMTSKPVAFLLADLGITKTHSRPHVSNDNPYSEAQFKTLKYRPDFPARFTTIEETRVFCRDFFPWYNTHHQHAGPRRRGVLIAQQARLGGDEQQKGVALPPVRAVSVGLVDGDPRGAGDAPFGGAAGGDEEHGRKAVVVRAEAFAVAILVVGV